MIGRIIEIAEPSRYLFVSRGFMLVRCSSSQNVIAKIPLDDIEALITHANGLVYSNNLLAAFSERGIPLVICGSNHHPISFLLPFDGHHVQALRFRAQISASKPLQKKLWASIVSAKLVQQALVLEGAGGNSSLLFRLSKHVKSGDPDNLEAQGARYYWRSLFGNVFRRNQKQPDELNVLLNYGYTILRSSTARAVVAAGLHPTLSLFHHNQNNAMALVDDLIEPFRPVVDYRVWCMYKEQADLSLTSKTKSTLVHCLYEDMQTHVGRTPVGLCIQRLAVSLAQVYLGERKTLIFPEKMVFKEPSEGDYD